MTYVKLGNNLNTGMLHLRKLDGSKEAKRLLFPLMFEIVRQADGESSALEQQDILMPAAFHCSSIWGGIIGECIWKSSRKHEYINFVLAYI